MEVEVEVECGAESLKLNQGDRAGLGAGRDGKAGTADEEGGYTALHHRQHVGQYFGFSGQQESQREGKGQYELTHRRLRKHMIDQVSG